MVKYYNIDNYKTDLDEAEKEYESVILAGCMDHHGGIAGLDSDQIYELKAHASGIKNQIVSAAGKRLRAGVALKMLDKFGKEFDLTVTLAVHITKHLMGRAISRKILLLRYGTKGRTASNKSEDFALLDKIYEHKFFINGIDELNEKIEVASEIRKSRANLAAAKAALGQKTNAQRMLSASAKKGLSS